MKTDGNLNKFSQCLGEEEEGKTKMYPAGFYLVKPFHLLNKDVLNKDNLSSNEATPWCKCGAPAPQPRVPHRRPPGAAADGWLAAPRGGAELPPAAPGVRRRRGAALLFPTCVPPPPLPSLPR